MLTCAIIVAFSLKMFLTFHILNKWPVYFLWKRSLCSMLRFCMSCGFTLCLNMVLGMVFFYVLLCSVIRPLGLMRPYLMTAIWYFKHTLSNHYWRYVRTYVSVASVSSSRVELVAQFSCINFINLKMWVFIWQFHRSRDTLLGSNVRNNAGLISSWQFPITGKNVLVFLKLRYRKN